MQTMTPPAIAAPPKSHATNVSSLPSLPPNTSDSDANATDDSDEQRGEAVPKFVLVKRQVDGRAVLG